ncbi:MAG: 30S ribosomal protein S5 [Candidatus Nanoarchaeia archaeon]
MAQQKKLYDEPKEVTPAVKPEELAQAEAEEIKIVAEASPKFEFKTELGKKVAAKEITDLKEIFAKGYKIKEAAIVDALVPNLFSDFILIGQARGKFGGGKRRRVKQTQKKTAEGNKPNFSALAIVGNNNGYVGIGKGKAKESIPAQEKALRNAKLNLIEVVRGCGSWKCSCGEPHSLPYEIEGKCGSVRVKLMPAPKGTGLVCENEIKKVLKAAGYKDIWAKTRGQTRHKGNFILATFQALKKGAEIRAGQFKVYRGAV